MCVRACSQTREEGRGPEGGREKRGTHGTTHGNTDGLYLRGAGAVYWIGAR